MDDRALMQALLDTPIRHGIVVTDLQGKIILWNRGAEAIFGYSAQEIIGASAEKLFVPIDRSNGIPGREMSKARTQGCAGDFRWHLRKDGTTFWGDGMMYPVRVEGADIGYMKVLRDATDLKLSQEEHRRLAFVDVLTGMPNRAELFRRLVDMMGTAQRHREMLVLLLVDLDHLKDVNDSLGHAAGDAMLRSAAQRMRDVLRSNDLLARLGGDEFAILQPGAQSLDDAVVVAEKLLEVLAQPMDIGGREVQVTGSIGISAYPLDAATTEQLLGNADVALYQAKAGGRNQYRVHEATMKHAHTASASTAGQG
ncbi:sensor domain-containing diguanylate cyclase [Agrilutibacter solisilvae]|uniref:GGDEF domain-containing protein n=1 Tax=Agrilutibacter solisilvae TaxID=2763317 RepID=A0A974Y112_9GAMM|nr:sensor domain-containing diguanylate cyclase [Lysobacter solisilvae]QSX78573.1 GGDEF domain-containing protein [Lysobacter solisilvae]